MILLKINLNNKTYLGIFLILLTQSQLLHSTNEKKNQAMIKYRANETEHERKSKFFESFIEGNTCSQQLMSRIEQSNFSDLIDLHIMVSPETFLRIAPEGPYDFLPGELPALSIIDLIKLKYNENFALAILKKKERLDNPLHFAIKQNSLRQVLSIIDCAKKFNIDISLLLTQKNLDGKTPFNIALRNKSFKILAVLIGETSEEEIFTNYLKKRSFEELIDWPDGYYFLSYVLRKNFTIAQSYLLNTTKQFGNTILHQAALTKNMSAFILILGMIKSLSLNLIDYMFFENDDHKTPYDILKENLSKGDIKKILDADYEDIEKINKYMLITTAALQLPAPTQNSQPTEQSPSSLPVLDNI